MNKLFLSTFATAMLMASTALAQDTTISVAAFEGGYGRDMYTKVVAAFEAINPGIKVDLTISRTIGEELAPKVAAGDFPDVVMVGQGSRSGITENFIRGKMLEDVSDVLSMTVPGEAVTVGDKLTPGIIGSLATNPYGDDKTYLMPVYASPTGLVYDAGLFQTRNWTAPTDFDALFALAETAETDSIALFTYPTAGYLDSYFPSILAAVGGPDFYRRVASYERDIWLTPEARKALDLTSELLANVSPTTLGYANNQDFTRNQQSILDNTALFMPNGAWIVNEMKDGPRPDHFAWGFTPVPAIEPGGTRYVTTTVEAAWVPAGADQKDAARQFLAFLYSDVAAVIFAESNAIQPILGLADHLQGDAAIFYGAYGQPNVEAVVGGFAATNPVPGVDIRATLFDSANSIIDGSMSVDDWQASLNEASNRLSDQLAN